MKNTFYILLAVFAVVTAIFIFKPENTNYCQELVPEDLSTSISQLLILRPQDGFKAEMTVCQRQGSEWRRALTNPFPVVIGKQGVAPIDDKKEGDLKTPAGLYAFGDVFGSRPLAVKMDYKYITSEDKFIDDPTSPKYNTWVHGETDAKSYETMLRDSYKMGTIINYNMNPVVPSAGSAIFMHLWKSDETPTFGCIAMDKPHLSAILNWFDKKQHPHILVMN